MAASTERFIAAIRAAMRESTRDRQRAHTAEAVQAALQAEDLLEGWEAELSSRLEFHLLQEPEAAIKVFVMDPHHPKGPPHDHGGLWGCYATYRGNLIMDFFEADATGERVQPAGRDEISAGRFRFVDVDTVHQVWVRKPSLILTIYNGDLNRMVRRIFDLERGRVIRDQSRWEERLRAGGGQQYLLQTESTEATGSMTNR